MPAFTIVRGFEKAGIFNEKPHGNKTDSDNDEREPNVFNKHLAQPFASDTEDEYFKGSVNAD